MYSYLNRGNISYIIASSLLFSFPIASASAGAIDNNGKEALTNMMVSTTQGFWDDAIAGRVVDWLNTVDPNKYSIGLIGDDDGSLSNRYLSDNRFNQWLVESNSNEYLVHNISGGSKKSSWNFKGGDQFECTALPSQISDNPDAATKNVENCLGEVPAFGEEQKLSLATAIQVATVSNTFTRPTSFLSREIRRFAHQSLRSGSSSSAGTGAPAVTGGGSSADDYMMSGRVGAYFSGGGSFGNLDAQYRNNQQTSNRFDIYNQTGTGAVDFRFADWAVAGLMFNYTGTQNVMALGAGNLNADSYRFMPFVSFIPIDNAYVDVMAGYGYLDYMQNNDGATASYSSDQALASIDLGYSLPIDKFELTGFAGGSYIGTNVNGYTESNGTRVNSYNVSSWTSTVGSQILYNLDTSMGVVQPVIRGEWVHGYNNSGTVYIVPLGGTSTPLPSALGITDWGNLIAGVQTVLPEGAMVFLNYQGQFMNGGQNNGVLGGFRLQF